MHNSAEYIDTFKYDYAGNKTEGKSFRAYNEGWAQAYTSKYEYNYAGKLTKQYNINGDYSTTGYDALGRVTSVTDIKGNKSNPVYSTTYTYDNMGRMLQEKVPFQSSSGTIYYSTKKHYYDRNGNVLIEKTANNKPGETESFSQTGYEYNSRNMLAKTTTYSSGTPVNYTQYYYDAAGNKLRMYTGLSSPLTINGLDNITPGSDNDYSVTKYEYNRFGKLTKMTDPLGQSENYTYDLNNNLTQKTDRNGNISTMTYDGQGKALVTSVTTPDGTGNAAYTYTYFKTGSRATMSGGGINTTYGYDDLRRLITETESNGIVKQYTYDMGDNRK
jgi:YD repeat-containing protein